MKRPLLEPSKQFLDRLSANVEKVFVKKKSKKKQKSEDSKSEPVQEFSVGAKLKNANGKEAIETDIDPIENIIFQDGLRLELMGTDYQVRT